MGEIVKKQKLGENLFLIQVKNPEIAKAAKPGQFVMLQISENGERIPLSIADFDAKTITIIFSAVGKTTNDLAKLKKGSKILHLAGPLGNPAEIVENGEVCLIGGGFGLAPIYLIAKAMKSAGTKVTVIAGAKNKKMLFWEGKLSKISDEFIVTTDDGSKGIKGNVCDALDIVFGKRRKFNLVFAVGSNLMMANVAKKTYQRARTIVSLNSIMLDGTGMCGSCRVKIAGETKFSCVDGPHFNAHAIEWDEIINRDKRYEHEEKHVCRCNK